MAGRIATPSRIQNLFGAGEDGFGDNPPDQTALDAAWFNGLQEEVIRPLEDQGIVPNAAILDQLTQALNSWGWSGTPKVKTGADLQVQSGGKISIEPGGTFECDDGATFDVNTNATFDSTSGIGLFVMGDSAGAVAAFDNVNAAGFAAIFAKRVEHLGDIILNGNKITGTLGSELTVETATVDRLQLTVDLGFTAVNQFFAASAVSRPLWRSPLGTTLITHASSIGLARATGVNNTETGLAATTNLDTSGRTGLDSAAGDIWVSATVEVQRSSVGTVSVSIFQGDGGGPEAFAIVGSAVTKTCVDTSDASDWTTIVISRQIIAPGIITRTYRLAIAGLGGSTAKIREGWIRADPFTK